METASIMGTPTPHGNTCLNTRIYVAFSHIAPALCSHENLKSLPSKTAIWEHRSATMGTRKTAIGTLLGTHFVGLLRNIQALCITKNPYLSGFEGDSRNTSDYAGRLAIDAEASE
jgi:hypothetical protein